MFDIIAQDAYEAIRSFPLHMSIAHLELSGHSEEECCQAVYEQLKHEDFDTFYIGGTGRSTEERSRDGDHVKCRGRFFTIKTSNDMMECLKMERYLICNLSFEGKRKTNKSRNPQSYSIQSLRWEVYIKLMNKDMVQDAVVTVADAARLLLMGVVVKHKHYTCHSSPDKEYHPTSERGGMYIYTHCTRQQRHKYARSWRELLEYEHALCCINTMQTVEKVMSMEQSSRAAELSRQERLDAMDVEVTQRYFRSHPTPHKFYHPRTSYGKQYILTNSTRRQALDHMRSWKELLQFEDGLIGLHWDYLNKNMPL